MQLTIIDVLEFLIRNGPGRTASELSVAIFGDSGYQQRVNSDCGLLVNRGLVTRVGAGGPNQPYKYFPAQ